MDKRSSHLGSTTGTAAAVSHDSGSSLGVGGNLLQSRQQQQQQQQQQRPHRCGYVVLGMVFMYLLLSLWELQSTQVWWKFYKVVLFDSFYSSEYAPLAGVHYNPHNRVEHIDVTLDEPPLGAPQQQLQLLLHSSSSSTTTTSVPYYATATTTATATSSCNKNNRNSENIHGCPEKGLQWVGMSITARYFAYSPTGE